MNLFGTHGPACGCGISRRGFLAGGAALTAVSALPGLVRAQTPPPFRIDIHHHLTPPD